jgi:hypothetical protein
MPWLLLLFSGQKKLCERLTTYIQTNGVQHEDYREEGNGRIQARSRIGPYAAVGHQCVSALEKK